MYILFEVLKFLIETFVRWLISNSYNLKKFHLKFLGLEITFAVSWYTNLVKNNNNQSVKVVLENYTFHIIHWLYTAIVKLQIK